MWILKFLVGIDIEFTHLSMFFGFSREDPHVKHIYTIYGEESTFCFPYLKKLWSEVTTKGLLR